MKELLTDIEHRYFYTTDGVKLHYAEIGSGPPLIMIPGGLCAYDYFAYQIPTLSQHFRLLILDPRGLAYLRYLHTDIAFHVWQQISESGLGI